MRRFLGQLRAKGELVTHIFKAKGYAKTNKKAANKIKDSVDERKNLINDIESAIKERSIKRTTETTKKFINECINEFELLGGVQERVFIMEYKMIKGLRRVLKSLNMLKKGKTEGKGALIDSTVKEGLMTIYKLFNQIHKATIYARKQTKRAEKGEIGFKELKIEQFPDALEFRSLKVSSRKERKEIKRVDRVLEDLDKVINSIYQGEVNNANIEKVKSDIVELKSGIEHELVFHSKALSVIAVLMKRLMSSNNEEREKVLLFFNSGGKLLEKARRQINGKQKDFDATVKLLDQKLIDTIRTLETEESELMGTTLNS